jgi:hypothetical protein
MVPGERATVGRKALTRSWPAATMTALRLLGRRILAETGAEPFILSLRKP